ncbi:hypothetical protein FBZ89_10343 [Nitrospirillum amazonense]|uniref:Uncharacterized protein n=1 Tax=Nitrospirillum amazonense TaxID=28077 RepID=A0A560FLD4_9PROT|nr:hypothetical protein [Nitrospirillum amazonense]TWB22423.1 hypothetical protein FBZ89_10343 [Nitrospirillum amazonense]
MKKDAQILQDVPAFNAIGLGLVFGMSELAVYGAAQLLLPGLGLKMDIAILAWGASLMILGPTLGLAAIYGLHQVVAKSGPGKPSGHSLAPVPPGTPGSDDKPTNWFPYDPDGIDMFDTESPYPHVGGKVSPARPLETVR